MSATTRTIRFRIAPELAAYFTRLDQSGRQFVAEEYDLFAAGYRAAVADQHAVASDPTVGEASTAGAVAVARERVWPEHDAGKGY